jgi:hypothetical protein
VALLLLKPLRLFLSSEDVRRIRIMVLKVTHVPFVALIWIYEGTRRFAAQQSSTQILTRAPQATNRPISSSQLSLSPRQDVGRSSLTRPSALSKNSLHEGSQSVDAANESASTGTDNNAELIALVQSLALKVDSLTAMIAAQRPA